jgi:hypothetical protein
MAALTAPRNSPRASTSPAAVRNYPIADNVKIYPGALVVLNSSGLAEPATAAASKIAVGRYEGSRTLDNTVAGHAASAFLVPVSAGDFWWDNKGGDLVTQAMAGAVCYVEDDHTVRLTSTGSSTAGKVVRVGTGDEASLGVLVTTNVAG